MNQKEIVAFNKGAIGDVFKALGITTTTVTYLGEGDSGGVETVDARRGDELVDLTDLTLSVALQDKHYVYAEQRMEVSLKTYSLEEGLRAFCYDVLEAFHPGWEINEGSSGKLLMAFTAEGELSVTLEHETYWTSSEFSTSTI